MAIYHLEAKVVSRGAGRSAVAASAYLSCSRLYNDYDGIQHDYTKKQGLVWQEVFLPEYAPQEWENREKLWNAVEEVETAKDSRLAREFVVALPIELSREQQIELLQDFIREQFVADGMCADAAIHDTDGHNPHAHILLTVRPLDEQGKWQYKTEKEYLCMIFAHFVPFPLGFICFPSLFESAVSICSTPLCGWLCGQKYLPSFAGGTSASKRREDFSDFRPPAL